MQQSWLKNKNLRRSIFVPLFILGIGLGYAFVVPNSFSPSFQAALLPASTNVFDGMVYPVEKIPNWVSLSQGQWEGDYQKIPANQLMPFPAYDPVAIRKPYDQLNSQSPQDVAVKIMKITHPAVYMGSYKFDYTEYKGSHLGDDIRIPKNTPIRAVGNGVVWKVGNQVNGFGLHVIIKHENFPSFSDPNKRTTYYSNYCHLGRILVSEGQKVRKGDVIGKSGQTGLASIPHLHFQIDNDLAPFHPYWPFTFAEQEAAHLDYAGAVNAGLGKGKAIQVTINPMMYIQKYLNYQQLHGSAAKSVQSTGSKVPLKIPSKVVSGSTAKPASSSSTAGKIILKVKRPSVILPGFTNY